MHQMPLRRNKNDLLLMSLLPDLLARFWRVSALAWLLVVPPLAWAGSIGFSVSYTGDELVITNTGNEAGYQFSIYTLGPSMQWQAVSIAAGNIAYLLPGQSLKGRRQSGAAPGGLGRADPLLVLFHDQAGSPISQLAWRLSPPQAMQPMLTHRDGRQLQVSYNHTTDAQTLVSYGIGVPYAGVAQLARQFTAAPPPPNPLRHAWDQGPLMTLDTGAGQGGTWLLHESATGELQLQIVADGKLRGAEQVPFWLIWMRQGVPMWAAAIGVLGALLLAAGFVWKPSGRRPIRGKVAK